MNGELRPSVRDLPRLYAVTDEKVVPNEVLLDRTARLLDAGVRLFQVRFKDTLEAERLRLGAAVRTLLDRYGATLIANDSPELASEIGADGVHLGVTDGPISRAREILGPDAIVGASGYEDEERIARWGPEDVTYLGLSSPHPSPTKAKPSPRESRFPVLVALARVPVFAIGGMTPKRARAAVRAGCHGVAAVSSLYGEVDVEETVRRFLDALRQE